MRCATDQSPIESTTTATANAGFSPKTTVKHQVTEGLQRGEKLAVGDARPLYDTSRRGACAGAFAALLREAHGNRTDLTTAKRFLSALAGGEPVTFQTFADINGRGTLARILHGPIEKHDDTLQDLNYRGAGVFVMVNEGDLRGRRAENVVRVRALFADLDGAPLAPILAACPPPHIVVESSPGRYHAYWLVADCPLDRFPALQSAIAAKFGSDPVVKDLPRVMRLPGFIHQKGASFQTRIHGEHAGVPYTVNEIETGLALFPPTISHFPTTESSDAIPPGHRNNRLMSIAGTFRQRGMNADEINNELMAENTLRCQPPLDTAEVRRIADSAGSYPPGKTRNTQNRKTPAYLEYASDMLANREFKLLSLAERGLLQTLRYECWVNKMMPYDPAKLAKLLAFPKAEIESALPNVMSFFTVTDDDFFSQELEDYRTYLERRKQAQADGGKKGMRTRWPDK